MADFLQFIRIAIVTELSDGCAIGWLFYWSDLFVNKPGFWIPLAEFFYTIVLHSTHITIQSNMMLVAIQDLACSSHENSEK